MSPLAIAGAVSSKRNHILSSGLPSPRFHWSRMVFEQSPTPSQSLKPIGSGLPWFGFIGGGMLSLSQGSSPTSLYTSPSAIVITP